MNSRKILFGSIGAVGIAGLGVLAWAPTGVHHGVVNGEARLSPVNYPIKHLSIAAQSYSEPLIDDYMIKDLIEAKTPVQVDVTQTSGASSLLHSMITQNNIQIYVGYDGTEFTGPLGQSYTGKYKGHPERVAAYTRQQELKQWNLWVSPSLGYEDTYSLAVQARTAKTDHLKTVSDAVKYANGWVLGTDPTFQARQGDGLGDFEAIYGIHFKSARAMTYDLMYPALATNALQAAVVYSTDGRLKKLNEVPLLDNKAFFPPYHADLIIRDDVVKQDHLDQVLQPLYGLITTADQTELNYQVDVLKKDPAAVAKEFLVQHKLLK